MSDPSAAVDGDPSTAWTPGPQGRMVVDLGSRLRVHDIRTDWTSGHVPALRVEFSSDGLGYTPAGKLTGHGRTRRLTTDTTTRYVALTTDTGEGGSARLIHLSLL
ncbi:hypothetical protein GCM10010415_30740 [Streptomyces atrovirens]|uniref:Discoidin domain-containing protein n=1 Tax=Streptomyces atrovirens TaxID=285556 RepID=A0ABW0DV49_9ACTN